MRQCSKKMTPKVTTTGITDLRNTHYAKSAINNPEMTTVNYFEHEN